MSEVNTNRKNRGRRPTGGNNVKDSILKAASDLFARQGYDRTSLRHIASAAEVDPSLILHYFGSKKKLFVTSMAPLLEGPRRLPTALEGDSKNIGERLATMFVKLIANDETQKLMLGMFRSVSSDTESASVLQEFVEDAIMTTIEEYLPGPNKRLQANILGSQMIGIFVARYIVKVEPLASIDDDQLIKYLAPRIQAHFIPMA